MSRHASTHDVVFDPLEPAFLLCPPLALDTRIANNATMRELGREGRRIDRTRALKQWRALYHHLAARHMVHLLPAARGLQDQTYVANVGVVLTHRRKPLFVLSRFRAKGREGEPATARAFLRAMGVRTVTSPEFFEGEADFKPLRANIYVGGHGLRSSRAAHRWLASRFGAEVIPVRLRDPHLYHLDCVLHVLGPDRVVAAVAAIEASSVRRIERFAEIVDVPTSLAYRGVTNIARAGDQILCDSLVASLPHSDPRYRAERGKVEFWEAAAARFGLTPVYFDLSEFHKSGAMLSCLVLPLTYPHLRT